MTHLAPYRAGLSSHRIRLLSLTILATLAACSGGDGDDDGAPLERSLAIGTTSLIAGQTTTATVRDGDGAAIADASVQWSSSDEAVAHVSSTGFVTTFGGGTATITASVADDRLSAALAVSAVPTNIADQVVELSPPVYSEAAGGGVAVIVDAPAAVASVSLLPYVGFFEIQEDPIPLERLAGSNRFVAVLPEDNVRVQVRRARASVICEGPSFDTCTHYPTHEDNVLLGWLTTKDAAGTAISTDGISLPLVPIGESSVAVTALAPDVQRSASVVNVRLDEIRQNGTTLAITQTFYRHFDDAYDYLVLYETAAPSYAAFFESVRNRVSGIGLDLYDHSAVYGASASGELRGLIHFGSIGFNLGHQVVAHEMGHAFINFLRATRFGSGTPHWPLSTAAFGLMGVSAPNTDLILTPLDDDTYRVDRRLPYGGMNDLELYLFGLADPSEVEDQIVFDPQRSFPGDILRGPFTHVTIDDVISAHGPRAPAWNGSPVAFRLASIVVSRGRLLTPIEMAYFERGARHGEDTERRDPYYSVPFALTTRGRGALITRLD